MKQWLFGVKQKRMAFPPGWLAVTDGNEVWVKWDWEREQTGPKRYHSCRVCGEKVGQPGSGAVKSVGAKSDKFFVHVKCIMRVR